MLRCIPMTTDFSLLDAVGLNLQAVFDLSTLPPAFVARLMADHASAHGCKQLILIGNAGPALWRSLPSALVAGSADPIDEFSVATVLTWFAQECPGHAHVLLYPAATPVELQLLGARAGWHRRTPFMLGIHPRWGSWFGYRVALLADTRLAVTAVAEGDSPCLRCADPVCISACPAQAMENGHFFLERCIHYRVEEASACASRCAARDACPVGGEYRYDEAQLRHCYQHSLQAIRTCLLPPPD